MKIFWNSKIISIFIFFFPATVVLIFYLVEIFRMMASRVTLDSQGRLVHRENGKLILPFEHFANAVMLKHMNRPHSMHLNTEATVRAVGACDH